MQDKYFWWKGIFVIETLKTWFLKKGCYIYTQRIWDISSSVHSTTLSWAELFTKHFCFDVSRQNLGRLNLEQNWNLTFDLFDISFKNIYNFSQRDYRKTTVLRAYDNPVHKKIVKNVRIQSKPAANAYDVPTKSWATTGSFTILSKFNRWKCFLLQSNQTQVKMVHAKDRETKLFTKFRLYIDYKDGIISESFLI